MPRRKLSASHRAKISRSMKGNSNAKGKRWTLSDATRSKMSDAARRRGGR